MPRRLPIALAALVAFSFAAVARAEPAPGKQTAEMYEKDGAKLGYLLYLPADYGKDPAKKWPVILFLHGSGEAGDGTTQVRKVAVHGPPKVAEREKDFGFIVISPQNPPKQRWQPAQVVGLLDSVMKAQKQADADRVYLTGLSLGGFGSWATAAAHPELFAAVAPICGGGNPADAAKIKDLPIWVVHGEQDKSVPFKMSVDMVEALKAAGAKDVQFTKHPDKGHDVWTVTYDDPKFYAWLLSHSRKKEGK
ncbi:MAG TPA: prolyl oligopeptidase family serine peptidase [Humisphaera sp.]